MTWNITARQRPQGLTQSIGTASAQTRLFVKGSRAWLTILTPPLTEELKDKELEQIMRKDKQNVCKVKATNLERFSKFMTVFFK